VVIVLIVPVLVSIFFFWLSKRNERIKSELARYETLFGDEEKTAEDL
jgi:hypothetical protein